MLIDGGSMRMARAASSSFRGSRINWRVVLDQLPEQFAAADVHLIRGLKDKRPSEVFAAITRWIRIGAARRKARGQYEKV